MKATTIVCPNCGAAPGTACLPGNVVCVDRADAAIDVALNSMTTGDTPYRAPAAKAMRRLRGDGTAFEKCLDLLGEWKSLEPSTPLAEMGHFTKMQHNPTDTVVLAKLQGKVAEIRRDLAIKKLDALLKDRSHDDVMRLLDGAMDGDGDDGPKP